MLLAYLTNCQYFCIHWLFLFIVIVKACKLSPLISSRREDVIRGPRVNKRPYWFMWECKKKGVIKASPYAQCYSLSSLFLTVMKVCVGTFNLFQWADYYRCSRLPLDLDKRWRTCMYKKYNLIFLFFDVDTCME